MTPYLETNNRVLGFPPRFGEHNEEIYGGLGYSTQHLSRLKENKVV